MRKRSLCHVVVAIACLVIPFSSCSKDDNQTSTEPTHPIPVLPAHSNQRVIVAYIIGDNNLTNELDRNLVWMYEGLAKTQEPSVLMAFYRTYNTAPAILGFYSDGKGDVNEEKALSQSELNMDGKNETEISSKIKQAKEKVIDKAIKVKTYPETDADGTSFDCTDPNNMQTILKDIKSAVAAPSYGLIFGGHATGWLPSKRSRALGYDFWSYRFIDIDQIAYAVGEAFGKGSAKTIDYILFDACMMGNAESCYELKDVSHYLLGSVIETPANGFPYHIVLPSLYAKGDLSGMLKNCVDQYLSFVDDFLARQAFGAYSVINCDKMDDLAEAMKLQLAENRSRWNTNSISLDNAVQYGQNSYTGYSYDMMDIITSLNQGIIPADFKDAFKAAVPYTKCINDGRYISQPDKYSGLGFYPYGLISDKSSWDQYFKTTKWYRAAGFDQIEQQ